MDLKNMTVSILIKRQAGYRVCFFKIELKQLTGKERNYFITR
jgi:hypothetical protein